MPMNNFYSLLFPVLILFSIQSNFSVASNLPEMEIFMLDKFWTRFLAHSIAKHCCSPAEKHSFATKNSTDKFGGDAQKFVENIEECIENGCTAKNKLANILDDFEQNFILNVKFAPQISSFSMWKMAIEKWAETIGHKNSIKLAIFGASALLEKLIIEFDQEIHRQINHMEEQHDENESSALLYELQDRLRWSAKNKKFHQQIASKFAPSTMPSLNGRIKMDINSTEKSLLEQNNNIKIALNLRRTDVVTMGKEAERFMKSIIDDADFCGQVLDKKFDQIFGGDELVLDIAKAFAAKLYGKCAPAIANNEHKLDKMYKNFEATLMSDAMHSSFPIGWMWMRELLDDVRNHGGYSNKQRVEYLFHGISDLVRALFIKYKGTVGMSHWLRPIGLQFHEIYDKEAYTNEASFEYFSMVGKCPKLAKPEAKQEDGTYGPWEFF